MVDDGAGFHNLNESSNHVINVNLGKLLWNLNRKKADVDLLYSLATCTP